MDYSFIFFFWTAVSCPASAAFPNMELASQTFHIDGIAIFCFII